MADIAFYLSRIVRPCSKPWRTDLGYFGAIDPVYFGSMIEAILRDEPMYTSELETRLCQMVPSARRDQIRWLLDFKFGFVRRELLHSRESV